MSQSQRTQIKRVDVLKLHLMTITSKDDQALFINICRMSIPCTWSDYPCLLLEVPFFKKFDFFRFEFAAISWKIKVNFISHGIYWAHHSFRNRRKSSILLLLFLANILADSLYEIVVQKESFPFWFYVDEISIEENLFLFIFEFLI